MNPINVSFSLLLVEEVVVVDKGGIESPGLLRKRQGWETFTYEGILSFPPSVQFIKSSSKIQNHQMRMFVKMTNDGCI